MFKLKFNTWKDLIVHALIILSLTLVFTLGFFYIYLPTKTNHGETITVPDVRGVVLGDLDKFLNERSLRYEVTQDSGFSASLPPLAVLKQVPLPNTKVKENRKIYVTLNAEHAPLVRMPKLVGGSVKNAQLVLKSYDLALGEISYVPDLALNYVLEQRLNGREVLEGERIPKGSVIDLVAGDGQGQQMLESPNLIGLDLESAQFAIIGSGLKVGSITYDKSGKSVKEIVNADGTIDYQEEYVPPGTVFKQNPPSGNTMRLRQIVDLWIYRPDSLSSGSSILEDN